ncbi:hypothetical protein [Natrialbaceae archaeon AArc-T1-2]|uniref:hypothetical protein n=1 Tax=Natrialbaceae archaeon AArc-T1-2 TaxID=3053904 RepID=UPI00255AEC49|nr:hypothetical protein [Natrialbaceae archaeon AArc-T1-2]WIV68714.1 hypothetical protein QQ977_02370 [Natrialbaceae archaeon AArc-T1-2]
MTRGALADTDVDAIQHDLVALEPETTLVDGESLALVCDENTEKKRCHRTILRDVLEDRLAGSDSSDC